MLKRLYRIANANWGHWRAGKNDPEPEFEYRPEREFHSFSEQAPVETHPLAHYYANLELAPGASREELKIAWRRLLKKYHPDLHSTNEEKKRIAEELTLRLNEAYHALDKELAKNEKG